VYGPRAGRCANGGPEGNALEASPLVSTAAPIEGSCHGPNRGWLGLRNNHETDHDDRQNWSHWRTAEKAVVAVIQEAYVHGVSTPPVDALVKAMGMTGFSNRQMSRL
jgi:Transposase, Mutator family